MGQQHGSHRAPTAGELAFIAGEPALVALPEGLRSHPSDGGHPLRDSRAVVAADGADHPRLTIHRGGAWNQAVIVLVAVAVSALPAGQPPRGISFLQVGTGGSSSLLAVLETF